MDLGLLVLRVIIGLLLAGHGAQKLFGMFGGYGPEGTGQWLASIGFRPGKPMAIVAGLSELVGGVLLALGFLSPLAAAMVIGVMVVAASTHLANGLWSTAGGYELPLLYAVLGAVLALTGPGALSVDALLGFDWAAYLGLAAIALGVLGGLVVVARARAELSSDVPAEVAA